MVTVDQLIASFKELLYDNWLKTQDVGLLQAKNNELELDNAALREKLGPPQASDQAPAATGQDGVTAEPVVVDPAPDEGSEKDPSDD